MHLQLHVQPVFPIWWLFLRQIPGSLAIPEVHAEEEWYKWLRHQKWDLVQNLTWYLTHQKWYLTQNLARYHTHQKWDITCTLRTQIFHFLHCLCSLWCPCVCNYLQKWKFSGSVASSVCQHDRFLPSHQGTFISVLLSFHVFSLLTLQCAT